MMLVDTHTHLYLPEFEEDRDYVIARAIESGIGKMIFPNVDLTTIEPMRRLHDWYQKSTFMAMGLHPTEISTDFEADLACVYSELAAHENDYIAVGEIGIDLYWDKTYEREQMEAFDRQVSWAVERGLPVIIHCRDGLPQTIEVLGKHKGRVKGVFHSFGGTPDDVEAIRRVGDFYFGINGIVTFKNCRLRDTLPFIGMEHILLETDAPYLAPVPNRGKRNETSFMVNTAETVATVFRVSLDELADVTTQNASNLFGISSK